MKEIFLLAGDRTGAGTWFRRFPGNIAVSPEKRRSYRNAHRITRTEKGGERNEKNNRDRYSSSACCLLCGAGMREGRQAGRPGTCAQPDTGFGAYHHSDKSGTSGQVATGPGRLQRSPVSMPEGIFNAKARDFLRRTYGPFAPYGHGGDGCGLARGRGLRETRRPATADA